MKPLRNIQSVGVTHVGGYDNYINRRPFVEVTLASVDDQGILKSSIRTLGLMDSGADITIIPLEIGAYLFGNSLLNNDIATFQTPSGEKQDAIVSDLMINICDEWFEIPVYFSETPIAILGRFGLFKYLNICFDDAAGKVFASFNE